MSDVDFSAYIQYLAVAAIPLLLGITLHEVAHGRMARRFGDRTAELMGRLSLNPLKHIDPVGTVLVPLLLVVMQSGFLFGWAKPVPVNPLQMRNPKKALIAVAFAGPGANLLMALGWAAFFWMVRILGGSFADLGGFFLQMARIGIFFNVLLATFNLIPIPPLDGSRILRGLVAEPLARQLDAIERYGLIIVLGLMFLGLLGPIVHFANFVMRLLGVPPLFA